MRFAGPLAGDAAGDRARLLAFDRRWDRAWRLLPYVLVAFAYAASLLTVELDGTDLLVVSVLVLVLVGWQWWFIILHRQWPEARLVPMAAYFAGLVALAVLLTMRAEPFTLVLIGCFPAAFVALPGRWAYAGTVLVGLCAVLALGGMRPSATLTVQLAGATALAAAVGWAIRRVEGEAVLRREAMVEIADVNAELQRANRENVRLRDQLVDSAHAAGITAERARLARDLHDTLAQGLAGITAQLETVDALLGVQDPSGVRVRRALELSRANLAEVRRVVNALRPGPLESDDLLGALRDTAADWQQHSGVPCRFQVTGTPGQIGDARQTALLRVVQEGLANVARHARATRATVTVSYLDDRVMVDVYDDGTGFDPARPPGPDGGSGYGLTAARERVHQAGGRLTVESEPGAGVVLTASMPLGGDSGGRAP